MFVLQPNFGASLHILKVEIGGDSQSGGRFHWFVCQLNFNMINLNYEKKF